MDLHSSTNCKNEICACVCIHMYTYNLWKRRFYLFLKTFESHCLPTLYLNFLWITYKDIHFVITIFRVFLSLSINIFIFAFDFIIIMTTVKLGTKSKYYCIHFSNPFKYIFPICEFRQLNLFFKLSKIKKKKKIVEYKFLKSLYLWRCNSIIFLHKWLFGPVNTFLIIMFSPKPKAFFTIVFK